LATIGLLVATALPDPVNPTTQTVKSIMLKLFWSHLAGEFRLATGD
jgi:hypothetical protein